MDLQDLLFPLVIFVLCGTVHEVAHAWMANRLGDPTARMLGRMSFNPIVHMDAIGTVLFPAIMLLTGMQVPLMWMKPVPVNPLHFRRWRKDMLLVALAGPVSNVVIALLFVGIFHGLTAFTAGGDHSWLAHNRGSPVFNIFLIVQFNLFMAVFNLVPIHPLDGSKILGGLLPTRHAEAFDQLAPYGMFILLACIFLNVFDFLYAYVVLPAGLFLMFGGT